MSRRPNVVFILADQLRASALPLYGEKQIETPNIDRLAREGVTLTNCIATCPVCTPYRSMLVTGRHPQTTGMIINSTRLRYSEIGLGDVFARAGYRTAWIGKWHLHTGAWPANNVPDWVPRGRSRMGFEFWRAYNQHMIYFNGFVNSPHRDFDAIRWNGYETDGLATFAFEFMDDCGDDPFLLFLSPQQPHWGMGQDGTPRQMAPDRFYEKLPEQLAVPDNVPEAMRTRDPHKPASVQGGYRNYLAMTLALDEMVGNVLDSLERSGRLNDTLVIFTSDHGTQGGSHGIHFWTKKRPYQESLHVPCVLRWPGVFEAGATCDALTSPVDFFPSLCRLCDIPVPRSVEGMDLSGAWRGDAGAPRQEAVFCMNFGSEHDHYADGDEWRGVRTARYQYARWIDGSEELYDLEEDPLQMRNIADDDAYQSVLTACRDRLEEFQDRRGDELRPGSSYIEWVDEQRRVVRNGYGPLGHPEDPPDWSLLTDRRKEQRTDSL